MGRLGILSTLLCLAPAASLRTERPAGAVFLLREGDLSGAYLELRAAVERDPRDEDAYVPLVDAAFLMRRPEKIVAFLNKLAARTPRRAAPFWALGRAQRRLDRLAEAESSLRAALAIEPGHVPALQEILLVARARGRLEPFLDGLQRQRAQPDAPLPALDYAIAQGQALTYHLTEAEEALARVPDTLPDASVLRAELLWERRRGVECAELVTNALARAVELAWPAAVRARLLHVRAECLLPTDPQRAFREAQAAREAYRGGGDLGREADSARFIAGPTHRAGRRAEALRILEQAGEVLEALGEKVSLAHNLQSRTGVYEELYPMPEALATMERAIRLAREAGDRRSELRLLSNTGLFLLDRHRYGEAVRRIVLALETARKLGAGRSEAVNAGSLGVVFLRLGDLPKASDYAERALALFRRHGDANDVGYALIALADIAFARGEFRAALEHYQSGAEVLGSRVESERLGAVRGMGRCLAQLKEIAPARRHSEEAVAGMRGIGKLAGEASALVDLGELELQAGNTHAAIAHFERALSLLPNPRDEAPQMMRAERGLGAAHRVLGRNERALEHYEKAIKWIETLRSDVSLASLRSLYFSDKRSAYTEAVETLYELHSRRPAAGYDRRAFRIAELARARTLLEAVTAPRPQAVALARQRASILDGISRLQASLFHSRRAPTEQARLRQAIQQQEGRLADLDVQALALAGTAEPPPHVVAPDELTSIVGPDVLVLEYFLGPRRSFVFAAAGGARFRFEQLPARATIERAVERFRERLARRSALHSPSSELPELLAEAHALFQTLMGPVAENVRSAKRLVVVPDGILFHLPFEALVTAPASGFLGEVADISYAPSASVLASLARAREPSTPARDLLAFGDPPSQAPPPRPGDTVRVASLLTQPWEYTPLPASRREVEAAAAAFPKARTRTWLGAELGEARVVAELQRGARFVHFATHAVLDEQEPARSGIVLAPEGESSGHDGLLQAREVAALRIPADLVTLSACQTGLGRLLEGEGLLGLARAFQLAGARSLVVSLWDVSDVSSARFMRTFYAALAGGAGKARALREARVAMRRDPNPALRHPYHWAGFVLQGAP